jgi:hypothetical protein
MAAARPQYGSGGGDQYGYGPGYSYARQAPRGYDTITALPPTTMKFAVMRMLCKL